MQFLNGSAYYLILENFQENVSDDLPMPPLFQFLTVLAFKIFVCEKVGWGIFSLQNDVNNKFCHF